MATRRILLPWESQPQERVRPSERWQNSCGSLFIPALGFRDHVSEQFWSTFGTAPVLSRGRHGVALDNTAAFGGVIHTPNKNLCGSYQTHILLVETTASAGNYSGLACSSDAAGANSSFSVQRNSSNTGWQNWSGGSPSGNWTTTSTAWGPSLLVLTGGPQYDFAYRDGVLEANGLGSGAGPVTRTDSRIVLFGERAASATYSIKGRIYFYAHLVEALSLAEIDTLTENIWSMVEPVPIWVPVGGVAGDPALTNNLATTASGILVPALSLAVTGNSATASRGTPVAALSLATTGNEVTASRGTPVASISLALTGQGATSSAGSVGVGGTTQAITGNAATASAGMATPALSLPITGNAATSAAGTVTPALSKAITGNAATSSAGTPVAAISLALTGQGATASAGTVAVPGLVVPTGAAATASQGSVSPGITVALTGNAVTASRGTVSPAISLALAGLAGTSAAGIVVPGLSKALTGNSATSAAGSALPATGNITLALTGNSATAMAGTLGLDQGVDSTWWMYTVPADDLTYDVGPDQLSYEIGV